jgi:hypothetical protein
VNGCLNPVLTGRYVSVTGRREFKKKKKNNGNPQLDSNRQRDFYQDPLPEE